MRVYYRNSKGSTVRILQVGRSAAALTPNQTSSLLRNLQNDTNMQQNSIADLKFKDKISRFSELKTSNSELKHAMKAEDRYTEGSGNSRPLPFIFTDVGYCYNSRQ